MANRKFPTLKMSWDPSDKYGSTMEWAFACAVALTDADEYVPDVWEYAGRGHVMNHDEDFEAYDLTNVVRCGAATWDDVRTLGDALLRYRGILATRGEDY